MNTTHAWDAFEAEPGDIKDTWMERRYAQWKVRRLAWLEAHRIGRHTPVDEQVEQIAAFWRMIEKEIEDAKEMPGWDQ